MLFQKHLQPKTPADLEPLPCIVSNCSSLVDSVGYACWRMSRERETREVRVLARVSVTDPAVHRQLTLRGLSLAMLPLAEAEEDVHALRLEKVLPAWRPPSLHLFALHRPV